MYAKVFLCLALLVSTTSASPTFRSMEKVTDVDEAPFEVFKMDPNDVMKMIYRLREDSYNGIMTSFSKLQDLMASVPKWDMFDGRKGLEMGEVMEKLSPERFSHYLSSMIMHAEESFEPLKTFIQNMALVEKLQNVIETSFDVSKKMVALQNVKLGEYLPSQKVLEMKEFSDFSVSFDRLKDELMHLIEPAAKVLEKALTSPKRD